jgi:hypothetical protein
MMKGATLDGNPGERPLISSSVIIYTYGCTIFLGSSAILPPKPLIGGFSSKKPSGGVGPPSTNRTFTFLIFMANTLNDFFFHL